MHNTHWVSVQGKNILVSIPYPRSCVVWEGLCVCVRARVCAELTRFRLLWKPDAVLQNDRKQEGIITCDESLEMHNNAELIAHTGTPVPSTAYVSRYI